MDGMDECNRQDEIITKGEKEQSQIRPLRNKLEKNAQDEYNIGRTNSDMKQQKIEKTLTNTRRGKEGKYHFSLQPNDSRSSKLLVR